MVKCITNQTVILPASHCQDYNGLLIKISTALDRTISDIKVFFVDARGYSTEIESDADVLGVKYMAQTTNITFRAEVSMSRQELEELIMNEQIHRSLASSYKTIAKKVVEEQMKLATQLYLDDLYEQISQNQSKINMVEKEEINQYFSKMNAYLIKNMHLESLPSIRQIKSENNEENMANISAKSQLQITIEKMVTRSLQSMMPFMVKEISGRIIDELRNGKRSSLNIIQKDQNPEEV